MIILVGPPIPRIGDKTDEFAVMTRRHPATGMTLRSYTINAANLPPVGPWWVRTIRESADQELGSFIRRWTVNEVDQAIGRLRADLRPDDKLIIYFLSSYPLEREVFFVKAADVTPDAELKQQTKRSNILNAFKTMVSAEGKSKTPRRVIAEKLGISQSTISRVLSEDV